MSEAAIAAQPAAPSAAGAAASIAPPPAHASVVVGQQAVSDHLDAVPGQVGHAVLRASDGTVLRPPTGSLTERDVGVVYRILLEIGTVLEGGRGEGGGTDEGGLQRVTIGFQSVSYAVAMGGGDGCVYIVKKRSSP